MVSGRGVGAEGLKVSNSMMATLEPIYNFHKLTFTCILSAHVWVALSI